MARRRLRNLRAAGADPVGPGNQLINYQQDFVFAIHFLIPGKENYSFVLYFILNPNYQPNSSHFIDLLHKFVTGDEAFRNSR